MAKTTLEERLKSLDIERETFLHSLRDVDVIDIDDCTVQEWMKILSQREQCLSAIFAEKEKQEFSRNIFLIKRLLSDVLTLSRISINDHLKLALNVAHKEISEYCRSDDLLDVDEWKHSACCACCYMINANSQQVPRLPHLPSHLHSSCTGDGFPCDDGDVSVDGASSIMSDASSQTQRRVRRKKQLAKEFLTVALARRDPAGVTTSGCGHSSSLIGSTAGITECSESDNDLDESANLGVDE